MRTVPASKMRLALKYPPPTTIIGALTYPIFRIMNWRDEVLNNNKNSILPSYERIKDIFKYVSARINGKLFTYGTLLRIHRMYNKKVDFAITSSPMILAYGEERNLFELAYLIDLDAAEKHGITKEKIIRAAWGITRIGSRESVFSVDEVVVHSPTIKQTTKAETSFAFEYSESFNINGNGEFKKVVKWNDGKLSDYTSAKWVPYFYPQDKVTVTSDSSFNVIEVDQESLVMGEISVE